MVPGNFPATFKQWMALTPDAPALGLNIIINVGLEGGEHSTTRGLIVVPVTAATSPQPHLSLRLVASRRPRYPDEIEGRFYARLVAPHRCDALSRKTKSRPGAIV